MLPCKTAEILEDAVDYLVELSVDERMPEELAREITRKADGILERIRDTGVPDHE